jgi:hypothetical protein
MAGYRRRALGAIGRREPMASPSLVPQAALGGAL